MPLQAPTVTPALQTALLRLLRDLPPETAHPGEEIERALRRYECGGYLHARWAGRQPELPGEWAGALAAAHRRTQVDNLAALAQFRALGLRLRAAEVPFLLLKGGAYLTDLYPDPGTRPLTDIDLLVRRRDAARVARLLRGDGYVTDVGLDYPENERFEAWRPGPAECRFEFHWRLGLPFRFRVDTAGMWERAGPCTLEGVECGRPGPEDAVLYHVAHLADHYFGPSLKWVIDLREMFLHWPLRPDVLADRAAAWRVAAVLDLVTGHLGRLFPGLVPGALRDALPHGRLRRRLFDRYREAGPLELLAVPPEGPGRAPLRGLMIDRPADAIGLVLSVLVRGTRRVLRRVAAPPPWEWRD